MSGRKEDDISAKILDPIVSGLNNEPDQETTTSEIGKKNIFFSLNSSPLWYEIFTSHCGYHYSLFF